MTGTLVGLESVSKLFVRSLDLVELVARRLGANIREQVVHAVDGVDITIAPGEAVGLIGETGSGKSTLGRIVADLLEASAGRVLYRGAERARLEAAARRRAKLAVQMIFQNPYASLNSRHSVRELIGEAPRVHGLVAPAAVDQLVDDLLRKVELDPSYKWRYPHQFSGGQRQRIAIARALAVRPELLVCDEPTAALDVSIQAKIINLLIHLREELGVAYLFISHDLAVVQHVADRIVIMYLGRIVESAPTEALFREPNHPYTRILLAEVPRFDRRRRQFRPVVGEIPSPLDPPPGCHFHPRCPYVMARCRVEAPKLRAIAPGRLSACHLNDAA